MKGTTRLQQGGSLGAMIVAILSTTGAYAGIDNMNFMDTRDAEIPAGLQSAATALGVDITAERSEHVDDSVVLHNSLVRFEGSDDFLVEEMKVIAEGDGSRIAAPHDDGLLRVAFESDILEIDIGDRALHLLTAEHGGTLGFSGPVSFRSWEMGFDAPPVFDGDNAIRDPSMEASIGSLGLEMSADTSDLDLSFVLADVDAVHDQGVFSLGRLAMDLVHSGLPDDSDSDAMRDALEDGAFFEMDLIFTDIDSVTETMTGEENELQIGSTSLVLSSNAEQFHLSSDVQDVALMSQIAGMLTSRSEATPGLEMERQHFSMVLPVLADEAPQNMAMSLAFLGVIPDHDAWDMFDPDQTFDRDPLDFQVDLDGDVMLSGAMTELLEQGLGQILVFGPAPVLGQLDGFDFDLVGRLSGLGAQMDLDAGFRMGPGDHAPQAQGTLQMAGMDDTLKGLAQSPLLGAQMVMPLAGMLDHFSEPDGADGRLLEFEIDQRGQATVNGNPLPM